MTSKVPRVVIDPQLQPHIKDFAFDVDAFAHGLSELGASDRAIDTAEVVFADSMSSAFARTLAPYRRVELGAYESLTNQITLFPRSISRFTESIVVDPLLYERSANIISAQLNSTLIHESDHLIRVTNMEPLELALKLMRATHMFSNMRRARGLAMLSESFLGCGIGSLIENWQSAPLACGLIGSFVLGEISMHGLKSKYKGEIGAIQTEYEELEKSAHNLQRNWNAIQLLGGVIGIELR